MAWRNVFQICHAHPIHGVALHAQHTDAELAGNQFADQFNTPVAKRVDIVGWFLGIVKPDQFADDCHQIAHLECAVFSRVSHIQAQALVQFVTANSGIIEPLEIKEHPLNHLAGVINRRQIARPQAAVNLN